MSNNNNDNIKGGEHDSFGSFLGQIKEDLWFPINTTENISSPNVLNQLNNILEKRIESLNNKKEIMQYIKREVDPQNARNLHFTDKPLIRIKPTIPPKKIEKLQIQIDIRPLIDKYNQHIKFVYEIYNNIITKINTCELSHKNFLKIDELRFEPLYLENTNITYNENTILFADLLKDRIVIVNDSINELLNDNFVIQLCK